MKFNFRRIRSGIFWLYSDLNQNCGLADPFSENIIIKTLQGILATIVALEKQ
jgi:hypothetical protein